MQRVSPEPPVAPALTYEYSWSLGCGVGAGLILMLGGGCFLLLALPPGPWSPLCPKWGQRATAPKARSSPVTPPTPTLLARLSVSQP